MDGIDWIWPNSKPTEERAKTLKGGLLKELDQDLALHLMNAVLPLADKLTERNHVRAATGQPFRCLAFYTPDEYGSASCQGTLEQYLTGMSAGFMRKLVKAASLVEPALAVRNEKEGTVKPSPEMAKLLEGTLTVSPEEAAACTQTWPHPVSFGEENGLGAYTVFYDLIRLIWVHEWAHALCGHVAFSKEALNLHVFEEFSPERSALDQKQEARFQRNEILQAFEIHADTFSVCTCMIEILYGDDPAGRMAGPTVNLVDRLLMFNVACCLFAVMWSLADFQNSPEESYFATSAPTPSEDPSRIFHVVDATHPPAYLRYSNFRDRQREYATKYGQEQGHPEFGPMVDAYSFLFLEKLADLCPYFENLKVITPVIAKTPTMKVVFAYADYLAEVSTMLGPYLSEYSFLPTDAYAQQG